MKPLILLLLLSSCASNRHQQFIVENNCVQGMWKDHFYVCRPANDWPSLWYVEGNDE